MPQGPALFRHRNFREWCVLHIFTSKCASRHNGVHFFNISTSKLFISHLASWLRTRRFSEPTSLFWLSPSLIFSISYLLLSDFLHVRVSSWLCFSSVHIVGSFTSKLPLISDGDINRHQEWTRFDVPPRAQLEIDLTGYKVRKQTNFSDSFSFCIWIVQEHPPSSVSLFVLDQASARGCEIVIAMVVS